jgi:hypothetical protein
MAQAILERILNEITELEHEELRRLRSAIEARLAPQHGEDAEERFLRSMFDAGLISELKRPDRRQRRERPLVSIQDQPLSETIIEERR